jgi:hypothetical protein
MAVLDAYDGHTADELKVAPWDNHPSAVAHRLLADRIYEEMRARPDLLRARPAAADGPAREASPGGRHSAAAAGTIRAD